MLKKLILVFGISFLLNWVWENLHSVFYIHYQGQAITQLILLRAAFFDGFFITLMAVLFWQVDYFKQRFWYALIFGFVFAVLLERWALVTSRWAYNDAMPIVPLLGVGLTPVVQLGITAYLAYKMVYYFDGGRKIS